MTFQRDDFVMSTISGLHSQQECGGDGGLVLHLDSEFGVRACIQSCCVETCVRRGDFLGWEIISIEFRDLKRDIVPKIKVTFGSS